MATAEQYREAARKAYAAGDVKTAKSLIARARKAEGSTNMGQLNRGIVNAVGGAVDFINPFDDEVWQNTPLGMGSAKTALEGGLKAIGGDLAPDVVPETVLHAGFRGAGEALPSAIPVGAAANYLTRLGGSVGAIAGNFARGLNTVPGVAMEAGAGAASGAAREGTRQMGGGETAQDIAGLAAPIVGLAPLAAAAGKGGPALYAANWLAKKAAPPFAPFTKRGGHEIAMQRAQGLVGDDRVRDVAGRIDPKSDLNLTPAQQTGDPGLLALERAAAKTDPELAARLDARREGVKASAETAVATVRAGNPADTAQAFADRRAVFSTHIKGAIDEAVARAGSASDTTSPRRPEMDNSLRIVEELETAFRAMKADEEALWAAVPDDATISIQKTKALAAELNTKLSRAQAGDMAPKIRELLLGEKSLSDVETVQEVRGLYSHLGEVARNAMAGAKTSPNEARIANEIRRAILADLGAVDVSTPLGRQINEARAFTAELHRLFDQGTVGAIRQQTQTGGVRIEPETALEKTVGRQGATADVSARQIGDAAPTDITADAVEDFLRSRFSEQLFAADGTLRTKSAQTWARNNAEILKRYPALAEEMATAITDNAAAQRMAKAAAHRTAAAADPRKSATAQFINEGPDAAISKALASQNPARSMAALANAARKDGTGAALDGLQASVIDHMMGQSRTLGGDLSGAQMMAYLNRNSIAMNRVLDDGQLGRLRRVAAEVMAVENAASGPALANISNKKPSKAISMLLRIQAATIGAKVARQRGASGAIQIPGMFSSRTQEALEQLTTDKATAILKDAVENGELMKILLLDMRAIPNQKKVVTRLAPYITGAIAEHITDG